MKALCKLIVGLLWIADLAVSVWCLGAIWFLRAIPSPTERLVFIAIFAALTLAVLIGTFWRRWILFLGLLLPIGFVTGWLHFLKPTGTLNWDVPFQKMPHTTIAADGHTVTIENVRDFRYRAEFDYDVRYRTETYDLNDIVSMDYSITHWNDLEPFGHIILSFGFKDGRHLAISPEARLEKGKVYEFFPGFYRVYELIFIAATEEDVFCLRTHHRDYEHEEVLLYQTHTPPEVAAFLLKDLLLRANELAEKPEFYNGILYNCLSSMAPTAEKLSFRFCTGWRGTFNGITDRLGYWSGWLKRSRPDETFAEMRARCSVNKYVKDVKDMSEYSRLLRKGFSACEPPSVAPKAEPKQPKTVKPEDDGKAWKGLSADNWYAGKRLSERDFDGKVALVYVWNSKEKPSVAMLSRVEEIWSSFKDKPLVVVGSHRGGRNPKIPNAFKQLGLTFPMYEGAAFNKEPLVSKYPYIYIVNHHGKIVYRGTSDRLATEALVDALTACILKQ